MNVSRLFRVTVVLWVLLAGLAGVASRADDAAVAALGFSPERLRRLDAVMEDSVAQHQIAGGVMYISRSGQTVKLQAYGQQDVEAGTPMATDSIFRIASMSKAVTTVAVMMLYEEGRFLLHDPVSKYIPAFKNSVVAIKPPEGSPADVKYVTVPARRPIEIRDLLTHTAGLTYGDGPASELYKNAGLQGWYFADKTETIGEVINRLAGLPLHGQPGEAFQYGYSTDVLGYLVEVVSGMPLDKFVEERICRPLEMKDTCFFLPLEKASRLAPVYGIEDGKLVLNEGTAKTDYLHGPRKCFSGGAGLLATISDYGRLLQMLLNEGELDGVRLLSPKTVELMRTNQVGQKFRYGTSGFGLGFWVIDDLGYYGELGSEGAYGWGSAYYPQYLIDPKEKLIAIFMTQLRPTGGLNLNERFKVLTYQALIK